MAYTVMMRPLEHLHNLYHKTAIGKRLLFQSRCCAANSNIQRQHNDITYRVHRSVISPAFKAKQLPEDVLALSFYGDFFTFVHLSSDLTVHTWKSDLLPRKGKRDHAYYQELVRNLAGDIPKANVYLVEESLDLLQNIIGLPTLLNRVRIETAMITLLNERHSLDSDSFSHSVYKLRTSVVNKYFDIAIGGHQVSCVDIVRDIINGRSEKFRDIYVPFQWLEVLRQKKSIQQNQMSVCLLHALFFYRTLAQCVSKFNAADPTSSHSSSTS